MDNLIYGNGAALTAGARDEALNITYGSGFADYSVPEADKNKYQTLKCLQAEALAQEGSFRYLSEYIAYSFAKRSLGSQNASVKMQAKHSLVQNPFEDPTKNFGLPDAEILGP